MASPRAFTRRWMAASMCLALALCVLASPATAQKTGAKGKRVAVLYFDYEGADAELAFLRKGMAEILIADLADMSSVTFIERNQLEEVIAEQDRSRTKRFDRKTVARMGRLLGAQYLVTGRFFTFRGRLGVVAKIIDVERGTTTAVRSDGPVADFSKIEAELSDRLRGKLSALEPGKRAAKPRRKRRKPKSISTRTAATYGKALDAVDRGDKKKAKKLLKKVASAAPKFELAARDLAALAR